MNVSLVLELSDKDAELKTLREEVERLKQAVPAVLVARKFFFLFNCSSYYYYVTKSIIFQGQQKLKPVSPSGSNHL